MKYGARMKKIDDCCNVWTVLTVYIITIASEFYFHMQNNALATAAHSFTVIIGIILLIKLSGLMLVKQEEKIMRFIKMIAAYSFFIYASHDFVQTFLKKISVKILLQTDTIQMIEYFIIPILTCAICIFAAAVLKKVVKPIYNILTGNRK